MHPFHQSTSYYLPRFSEILQIKISGRHGENFSSKDTRQNFNSPNLLTVTEKRGVDGNWFCPIESLRINSNSPLQGFKQSFENFLLMLMETVNKYILNVSEAEGATSYLRDPESYLLKGQRFLIILFSIL